MSFGSSVGDHFSVAGLPDSPLEHSSASAVDDDGASDDSSDELGGAGTLDSPSDGSDGGGVVGTTDGVSTSSEAGGACSSVGCGASDSGSADGEERSTLDGATDVVVELDDAGSSAWATPTAECTTHSNAPHPTAIRTGKRIVDKLL